MLVPSSVSSLDQTLGAHPAPAARGDWTLFICLTTCVHTELASVKCPPDIYIVLSTLSDTARGLAPGFKAKLVLLI